MWVPQRGASLMPAGSMFNESLRHPLSGPRGIWSFLHIDPVLMVLLLALIAGGLVVLYSGADQNMAVVKAQGVRMGVALVVMLVFAQLDPSVFRRWAPWLFAAGLAGLAAVLLVGVGAKGAQRWLAIPGLPRFQPSELMKLVVPMMAAWYLSRHFLPPRLRHVAVALVISLAPMAMIILQPDLGTSLLVGAAGIFVVFFAGISWRLIGAFFAMVSVAAPLMWFFVMRDYQKQRVLTLLDPQSDPWVPAGISFSRRPRSGPVAWTARAGSREPSPIWSSCPKAIPISLWQYWLRSSVLSACWRCWCFTC